jgi:hypothetical protein
MQVRLRLPIVSVVRHTVSYSSLDTPRRSRRKSRDAPSMANAAEFCCLI